MSNRENFPNDLIPERIPFEMRIPNDPNINTIVNNNIDNTSVLIVPEDKQSNFPLDINSMNIEEPKIVYTEPKPDEAFKDNRYIRDEGLTKAMKKVGSMTTNEYKEFWGESEWERMFVCPNYDYEYFDKLDEAYEIEQSELNDKYNNKNDDDDYY